MLTLATSVSKIVGVGPKFAQKLSHLGIEKVEDLLFYFPRRHDDLSHPCKISDLFLEVEYPEACFGDKNLLKTNLPVGMPRSKLRGSLYSGQQAIIRAKVLIIE